MKTFNLVCLLAASAISPVQAAEPASLHQTYLVLSDDTADTDAWLHAAKALLQPLRYDENTGHLIHPSGPIPGEVLREKKAPSVSDLLEKRLANFGEAAGNGDKDAARNRLAFLAILLEWDQARGRAKTAAQSAEWQKDGGWSTEPRGAFLSFIYKASENAPEILPLCEEVVWKLPSGDYTGWSHRSGFATQLMLKHGASMKRPAADLWTHPDSPWCLKSLRVSSMEDVVGYWRDQELISKAPFCALLDSLLTDDKSCGTVSLDPANPDQWTTEINFDKATRKITDDSKFALKPDTKLPIRRKDVAGRKLKEPEYAGEKSSEPLLEYHWSLEDRDKWLENLRKKLKSARQIGDDR